MLTAILLSLVAVEPYNNPANPNAPAYVKAEDAALQTTFAVEKFPKVLVAGRWADQGIAATDRVYIPAGVTVLIDTTDAVCETIRVDGTLKFARNTDTKLFVTTIVGPLCSSTLDAGTQADPITAKCEVVFRAKAVDINEDPREFGTGYVGHRTLVWGQTKQSQADFVNAVAGAGSVSFTAPPQGWNIGDTIVLAAAKVDGLNPKFWEKRVITGIQGATVSFAEPLAYAHPALANPLDKRFAINLTRNVVFRSENPGYGAPDYVRETKLPAVPAIVKQRGHFMVMGCGVGASEIGYAEFRDLGRTDKRLNLDAVKFKDGKRLETLNGKLSGTNAVGRYALHFHHGGRQGTPALVKGVSAHGSPGWLLVNHSSNVHFLDSVGFDAIGAIFVGEIGDEVGLNENCAAIGATGGHANIDGVVNNGQFDREQGTSGAGFWFQGGRFKLKNAKASGCMNPTAHWLDGTVGQVQVYSNNPIRYLDNIHGMIDPADIDPKGPEAYLLKLILPDHGMIGNHEPQFEFDGGLCFTNAMAVAIGPNHRGLIKNVASYSGFGHQYSGTNYYENCRAEGNRNFFASGIYGGHGCSSNIFVKKTLLKSFGAGITVPGGLSVLEDCTYDSNQFLLSQFGGNPQENICGLLKRPIEIHVERPTLINQQRRMAASQGPWSLPPNAMNRFVYEGKQAYYTQTDAGYIPFAGSTPANVPGYFKDKTNAQLLEQYGQCVNGDVTPADAVSDSQFGFKLGPVSKRLACNLRQDRGQGGSNLHVTRPSGQTVTLQVEFYRVKEIDPVIVPVPLSVAPGWQTVPVDFEGQRYGVNVFGTGSTPPPEPPTPPPLVVTTVEVTPANLTLEVGKTAQLSAVVKDQFGAVMPGKVVAWSSSNGSVATVQSSGAVAAIASGNAVITATADGKQGAANVTVTNPPTPQPPARTIKRVTIEYSDGTTETKP